MSTRISDVRYKYYLETGGTAVANDRVKLEGLPTPTCWLRGLQFVVPRMHNVPTVPYRFDFVTSPSGSSIPLPEDVLVSFPVPYFFGTQNFFLPEDSYFMIEDGELYITSVEQPVLRNYSITLFYT